jgi:hypothetical protein
MSCQKDDYSGGYECSPFVTMGGFEETTGGSIFSEMSSGRPFNAILEATVVVLLILTIFYLLAGGMPWLLFIVDVLALGAYFYADWIKAGEIVTYSSSGVVRP